MEDSESAESHHREKRFFAPTTGNAFSSIFSTSANVTYQDECHNYFPDWLCPYGRVVGVIIGKQDL